MTGLTRAEVKRIVDSGFAHRIDSTEHLPRALRVLAGWKSSRKYTKHGIPRKLRISGASPSFESLCKEFSGDIPHQAIVAELVTRELIKIRSTRRETVAIVARELKPEAKSLEILSYAASLMNSLTIRDQVLLWRHVRTTAPGDMSDLYFENSVKTRMQAMVDGLPQKPKRKRQFRVTEGLDVFAIVSRRAIEDR